MSEKIFQIGIIGLQGYGSTYFPTIDKIPYAKVRAVCDTNEAVLDRIDQKYGVEHKYTDYREMLKDKELDVVFIATPHFLHYRMTMDALNAGKHVFCEKPLAMNQAEAEEMVQTANKLGLGLSCHYNRRQSAPVKLLHDAVDKNVLGDVYAINLKWMARYTSFMFSPDSAWRTEKAKAGGGILIGRGSHMIDAALYILGDSEIKSISANICSRLTGLEVDDYCMLALRMKSGTMITIECSYENNIPQYSDKIEYQLFGTKAGAYCDETDGKSECKVGYCEFPKNNWVDLSENFEQSAYQNAYPQNIIADFMESLHDGRAPLITGKDAQYVTTIIDKAYKSAELGREIAWEE